MSQADEPPAPTLDDFYSGTCDWGHCAEDTYAVRWDTQGKRWLCVCVRHRAHGNVRAVRLDDLLGAGK